MSLASYATCDEPRWKVARILTFLEIAREKQTRPPSLNWRFLSMTPEKKKRFFQSVHPWLVSAWIRSHWIELPTRDTFFLEFVGLEGSLVETRDDEKQTVKRARHNGWLSSIGSNVARLVFVDEISWRVQAGGEESERQGASRVARVSYWSAFLFESCLLSLMTISRDETEILPN